MCRVEEIHNTSQNTVDVSESPKWSKSRDQKSSRIPVSRSIALIMCVLETDLSLLIFEDDRNCLFPLSL